ncbi:MAG: response regulator receiver protein [Bacteroidetes bacterium]|nr:response regulator receiver protein [Bacteroidota bacterium]
MTEILKHIKPPSILIVDDDKDDQFFLTTAIHEVVPDAEVKSFFDGIEVMAYLYNRERIPDLIFLDLNMSKMNGRSTVRMIKQDEVLFKIPVIILTTSSHLSDRLDLTDLGADDFYTKPVADEELKRIVEKVKNRWLA